MAVREVAAVGAIIVRDGLMLLVQRGHAPAAGQWSVPGGRVERGESDAEALAREVAEETGLMVRVGPMLGEVSRAGVGDVVYRIRDYLVEIVGGTECAGDDAADLAWVPLDELADRELTEGLLDTLRGWQVVPTPED